MWGDAFNIFNYSYFMPFDSTSKENDEWNQ